MTKCLHSNKKIKANPVQMIYSSNFSIQGSLLLRKHCQATSGYWGPRKYENVFTFLISLNSQPRWNMTVQMFTEAQRYLTKLVFSSNIHKQTWIYKMYLLSQQWRFCIQPPKGKDSCKSQHLQDVMVSQRRVIPLHLGFPSICRKINHICNHFCNQTSRLR